MTLDSLIDRVRKLQQEIDEGVDERRARFHYTVTRHRVEFERQIRRQHRKLRVSSFAYLVRSGFLALCFAPIVYSLIFPLLLLDIWVSLFQLVCFPVYGIQKVRRRDFIAIDRHHLAYLNTIEKINCIFCGYANGLLAYTRAIAGRSEEHWCPIKHARRLKGAQDEYWAFADFGDAEGFRHKGKRVYEEHLKRVAESWIEPAANKGAADSTMQKD